jgi:hypothetical protein
VRQWLAGGAGRQRPEIYRSSPFLCLCVPISSLSVFCFSFSLIDPGKKLCRETLEWKKKGMEVERVLSLR